MSRPHDAQRPFFPFSNPFRMIRPKGYLSPKLFALLNSFEETLAERLKKLKAKNKSDVFSFSWMRSLMESVSETHVHVKSLITDLQFPISDWDEKWMDMYLDNSIRLLDMCIVFSSELSRLNQGQLLIQHAAHVLDCSKDFPSTEQLAQGRASLHDWMERICSRNPKLESSQDIFQELTRSLSMPKLKSSAKGKVLIRAMYSVKVVTVFACSIFMAAFSGSAKMLMNLHVPEEFLWSAPFNELLQTCTSDENKALFTCGSVTVLKELVAVHGCVEKLYAATEGTPREERESLQKTVLALGESAEAFSQEIDLLTDQVDGFFQIVLTGRDALLCNLRLSDRNRGNNAVEQAVR